MLTCQPTNSKRRVDYSQLHTQLQKSSHSKLSLVQSSKFKSFFRPTPCGFRQVVQQLSKPVAHEINYLIRTGADAVVAAKVNWKRTDT